ncbi:MAG: nitronate monooxygenase [Deltaproteobacteria bacterium]|nr:nitronate monooxygenase [Deltaproteobacteria bacterium]
MFSTRITEMFGIDHPIIQGGMMWVSRAELVSAVSNAGCLGLLTALTFDTPGGLAEEIRKTREMTDKPFGVNMTLLPTLKPVNYDEYFDVIEREGIKIVETAGRSPGAYMEKFRAAGIRVIHKCTSVKHARSAQKLGCDAVSIDGFECAGHPGEQDIGSLVLVPAAADSLKIPVVASGGIADGRGLIAALALGADGINMGTRFLMTQEAPVHPAVKGWLLNVFETDTLLVLRSLKNSLRVLKTPVSTKVARMEKEGAGIEEIASLIGGQSGKQLLETGAFDEGIISVGQVIGLIKDVPSVRELVDRIISEAKEIATRLHS